MKTKYFFYLLFFISVSCQDSDDTLIVSQVPDTNKIENKNNNIFDTNSIEVLKIINTIDSNYLPHIVREYISNKNSVKISILNNYTVDFFKSYSDSSFYSRIQFIFPYTNLPICSISSNKKTSDGVKSYFYFLQNYNNNWTNVSQLVVTNYFLNYLENLIESKLTYKLEYDKYCFSSDYIQKSFIFNFEKTSNILVYENNKLNKSIEILFFDGVLVIKNDIKTKSNSSLLSAEELTFSKKFRSINSALTDSTNAYILDMSGLGVSKVSNDISFLKRLQVLVLDDNYFTTIPNDLCNLKKLQIIRINHNDITILPDNIGKLPYLEEFSVSYNRLNSIPTSLNNAENLKVLNLDNNNISILNLNFQNLINLTVLNISNNKISKIPESIGDLKYLVSLDISNNPISKLPEEIYKLKTLTYLNITNTKISENQIFRFYEINPEITIIMD